MHSPVRKCAAPSSNTASLPEEETLEVWTRSGRLSRPPSRLIDETRHTFQSRSRSRSSLRLPAGPSRPRTEQSPAPGITVTESENNTPERGRSPTLERQHSTISKAYHETYRKYHHLLDQPASLLVKLKHKWDKALDAATRKEEQLAVQYQEESKAITETLCKLDSEVDESK